MDSRMQRPQPIHCSQITMNEQLLIGCVGKLPKIKYIYTIYLENCITFELLGLFYWKAASRLMEVRLTQFLPIKFPLIELDKLINIEKLLITYHVQNKYIMRKILIFTHGMNSPA